MFQQQRRGHVRKAQVLTVQRVLICQLAVSLLLQQRLPPVQQLNQYNSPKILINYQC